MELTLTQNQEFIGKGCPGERLGTWQRSSNHLPAARFPVVQGWQNHRTPRQSGCFQLKNSLLSPVAHLLSVAQGLWLLATSASKLGLTSFCCRRGDNGGCFESLRDFVELFLFVQDPINVLTIIDLTGIQGVEA